MNLNLGDYVSFGRYLGEDILWRVIDLEGGCPILWSDKILCLKPFDAAESGLASVMHKRSKRISDIRQRNGSNAWEKSNLREWLNSAESTIDYATIAPNDDAVFLGFNSYENESGFLAEFTDTELAMITPRTHKVILSNEDRRQLDGGVEPYWAPEKIEDCLNNIDESYYKYVEDYVFLLSQRELYNTYMNNFDVNKLTTQACRDNCVINPNYFGKVKEARDNYIGVDECWAYWLETPKAGNPSAVNCVNNYKISQANAYEGEIGVVPALALYEFDYNLRGDGTIYNPFTVI